MHPILNIRSFGALLAVALCLGGCARQAEVASETKPLAISFNEHVRPIFIKNCMACHGGVKKAGKVSFIFRDEVLGKGSSGKVVVEPFRPEGSEMMRRVVSTNSEERMPPADHGEGLSEAEVAILNAWIQEGAAWEEHWAYVPPAAPEVRAEPGDDWSRGDIDRLVLAKMKERGLVPSPEADRGSLLRRLALDLTGLPPSVEEVAAFVADGSADAYERQVERLLGSPGFGERWASPWLDLARYADTMGYERDPNREIWPYRDWVIRALNEDMPFDRFTVAQLAGDLLPERTGDDLLATAFYRNSKTNVEGGTDDEEFRVSAVIDRTNTVWQAWMGTSFGCVQCHSHPYDPFSHESYYEFLAFADNAQDHDTKDEFPKVEYALDPEKRERLFGLQEHVRRANAARAEPFQALAKSVDWAPLRYETATASLGVTLGVERDESGRELIQSGANAPKGTVHTIVATTALNSFRALRIDALMQKGASLENPGSPFILSLLEVFIEAEGAEPRRVEFARAVADEANQRLEPEGSLDKDADGWAAYPKQHYDRWAAFVAAEAVAIPAGAKLRIVLHHKATHDGAEQPVLRRFRIALDGTGNWVGLLRSEAVAAADAARDEALAAIKEIERVPIPIVREREPAFARATHLFTRGDWLAKAERVQMAVPAMLRREARPEVEDRLEMARWVVSPENPLTARFAVNRHWEQLFGIGIVETIEDFGSAGFKPSHPELLDYLALRFQGELGWSVKALLRDLALSATYRQSSKSTIRQREIDPRNVYLSRGPRLRLTAEMARDNALQVSGLLSEKMYGPPVMPYQPDNVWRTVYNKDAWETSQGEDRHRRAVYTYWKRSTPYPSFITFDMPSRDLCSPRRITTNTPLQALVMLNDPVYMECAAALASLARKKASAAPENWIRDAYRRALLKEAAPADLDALLRLYRSAVAESSTEDEAMVQVANAILNLDEFLTK